MFIYDGHVREWTHIHSQIAIWMRQFFLLCNKLQARKHFLHGTIDWLVGAMDTLLLAIIYLMWRFCFGR